MEATAQPTSLAPSPDMALAEPARHGRWLEVVADDGAVLRVREDGAGPPLLLLHGWAARSDFFAPQAEALAGAFRVLRPDLRGHGRSSARGPHSIERLCADCAAIAEQLKLESVIAVGWSMGAMVLWRAIAARPGFGERIAGLAVVDMAPLVANHADWRLGLMAAGESAPMISAMQHDWASFAAGFTPNVFAAGAPLDLIQAWAPVFVANEPAVMASFWASMMETDCRSDVAALRAPMLVCYGAKSRLYAAQTAEWLVHAAQNARAVAFAQSGHAPHLEEPEVFNRLILEFAGSLPRPACAPNGQNNPGDMRMSEPSERPPC